MSKPNENQIERLPSVLARTGLPRSTLYGEIAKGRFCRPVQLTSRTIGFLTSEVDEWIRRRAAQRDIASQGK